MDRVTSTDGTQIAYVRSGSGPAVLIVGGALADHGFYAPLAGALEAHFTVYNFDRRGRGRSGDNAEYEVEREVEDVAALIAVGGESVRVYGHSAGAALALRAAAGGAPIASLVLADPPFTPHGHNDNGARAAFAAETTQIQALHDKGDHRDAAAMFLTGLGLSTQDAAGYLQSPAGDAIVDCARALPYDYAMLGDGLVPDDLAASVQVPTLLLAPDTSPDTARALERVMPNARYQPLPAATHELSPSEIAESVAPFLSSP